MKKHLTFLSLMILSTACVPTSARAQFGYPGGGYYPGYFPGYYVNSNTGNLYGSSQIIKSQGNLMLQTQQAKLMEEQVKSSKIDTRRKSLEEWKYERDTLPTTEDDRERNMAAELRRSRNDPPVTEVSSGYSLNVLLKDLQKLQVGPASASPVMLNQEALRRVNLTGSPKEISVGLFRGNGELQWPYGLRDSYFAPLRKRVETESKAAIAQAKTGKQVSYDTLSSLHKSVDQLEIDLKSRIADMPSNQWVEGKRYINQLRSSVGALEDPNVVNFYGKWQAKGSTVGELVAYMTDQGLRFAAANVGDEAAYQSIFRSMADYDVVLAQRTMIATAPPPKPAQGGSFLDKVNPFK